MSMLKSLPSEVDKVKEAVVGVATVDVSIQIGPPRHLASGILYGIPDRPDQIPDHFYKDIGFNYGRGGGSQLPGTKGYAVSLKDYEVDDIQGSFVYALTLLGSLCFGVKQLQNYSKAWRRVHLLAPRCLGC